MANEDQARWSYCWQMVVRDICLVTKTCSKCCRMSTEHDTPRAKYRFPKSAFLMKMYTIVTIGSRNWIKMDFHHYLFFLSFLPSFFFGNKQLLVGDRSLERSVFPRINCSLLLPKRLRQRFLLSTKVELIMNNLKEYRLGIYQA